MSEEEKMTLAEFHRKMAIDLFNYTWTFLDKNERSREEQDEMIHAAHASRFHWGKVGSAVNFARGEWQISRVYAVLKRAEPAHFHAQRCLDICLENGIGDFDLAFAYEALGRAAAVAGDKQSVSRYLELARMAGEAISEQDDRALFDSDLKTIPA